MEDSTNHSFHFIELNPLIISKNPSVSRTGFTVLQISNLCFFVSHRNPSTCWLTMVDFQTLFYSAHPWIYLVKNQFLHDPSKIILLFFSLWPTDSQSGKDALSEEWIKCILCWEWYNLSLSINSHFMSFWFFKSIHLAASLNLTNLWGN